MRGMIRRAMVVAGAAVVLPGLAAGVASASGTVALSWSPSGTFSYGTLNAGQTSPPQAFTLTNSGSSATAALKIALTSVTGPASAFTKTADTCTGTSLGPKKSCSVTVTYTAPATSQTDTATLTATSKKAAATATVTLAGASATAKASPALVTAPSAGGTAGTVLNDTGTLSGGASPGGSITFNLYDPSHTGCTGTPAYTTTVPVSGDGSYTTANTTAATAAGTWNWTATYSGDANNNPAASLCGAEQVTVTPAAAASLRVSGPATTTAGAPYAFTVTVVDAFGNMATGYTGTVHFTSSDLQAVLPVDHTFTAADNGVHTFSATLKTAGYAVGHRHRHRYVQSITGSQAVTVSPAAAARFVVSVPGRRPPRARRWT